MVTGLAIVSVVVGALSQRAIAKIHADRDTRIAEMALEGSEPGDRGEILDGLSKLRPFHPESPASDGEDPVPALRRVLGRSRRYRPD
jgi:hypothetical protein